MASPFNVNAANGTPQHNMHGQDAQTMELAHDLHAKTSELASLDATLAAMTCRVEELEQQLAMAKKDHSAQRATIQDLSDALARAWAAQARATEDVASARERLERARREEPQMLERVQQQLAEAKAKHAAQDALEARVAKAQAMCESIVPLGAERVAELERELAEEEAHVQRLQDELRDLDCKIADADASMASANAEAAESATPGMKRPMWHGHGGRHTGTDAGQESEAELEAQLKSINAQIAATQKAAAVARATAERQMAEAQSAKESLDQKCESVEQWLAEASVSLNTTLASTAAMRRALDTQVCGLCAAEAEAGSASKPAAPADGGDAVHSA